MKVSPASLALIAEKRFKIDKSAHTTPLLKSTDRGKEQMLELLIYIILFYHSWIREDFGNE